MTAPDHGQHPPSGGDPNASVEAAQEETTDQRAREARRLFLRYRRHGDQAAREELVERFMPLARQLARRYQRVNEPLDDLIQVASLGLVKAVDRFDVERGVAFSSYAVPTIGLLTGGFSEAELREAGADPVFESPAALRAGLDRTPLADGGPSR